MMWWRGRSLGAVRSSLVGMQMIPVADLILPVLKG
jgi:hypothetical protein